MLYRNSNTFPCMPKKKQHLQWIIKQWCTHGKNTDSTCNIMHHSHRLCRTLLKSQACGGSIRSKAYKIDTHTVSYHKQRVKQVKGGEERDLYMLYTFPHPATGSAEHTVI